MYYTMSLQNCARLKHKTKDEYGTSDITICFYSILTLIMIFSTQQDINQNTVGVSAAKAVNGCNAGAVLRCPPTCCPF
jgi:hypothetical protein